MATIQTVLLFAKIEEIPDEQRQKIRDIVREEYISQLATADDAVQVVLADGISSASNPGDIVLAIDSDRRVVNEGAKRRLFSQAVAERLRLLLPKSLGFAGKVHTKDGLLPVESDDSGKNGKKNGEGDRTLNYVADEPRMPFSLLKIPDTTMEDIEAAIKRIELEHEVFDEWGLYAIMPNPICALNFYGPPGTGKSMAADAIADKLGKKIIRASYADIESKYHGEGPKNVDAIFRAAQEQNAILFIDEADSLLSKRLTSVSQGSEQAINSMRSQLLICLERFHGIVIFATNLVVNYDRAFVSRLISIKFDLPDEKMREEIWRAHLLPSQYARRQLKIPLADDVNLGALAAAYEVSGRNIRNAVVSACVKARSDGAMQVTQAHLMSAIQWEVTQAQKLAKAEDHTSLTDQSKGNTTQKLLAGAVETRVAKCQAQGKIMSANDIS